MQDDALSAIEKLFSDYTENYALLIDKGEISFANDYKNQFAKIVLLACASYFESKLTKILLDTLNTQTCPLTYSFISKKALTRQYHTLFRWDDKNANSFFGLFGLFGDDFKIFMKQQVKDNEQFKIAIEDFLELGRLRNKLVHDNYVTFLLNLTVEEIQQKFSSAQSFINQFKHLACEFKIQIK
ncbi:HEPN domain-containing protein [Candidatus Albibeggiatoa sp. nov. BB20]|uniref:HEPN domain-containing protein n=1 Tax=Candidatus Albibeggiatoa sp. nov. BB20 TaxID=3162723 RepID=UPI0033656D92